MISHYLAQWGYFYVIHYGVWVTLLCFMDVHKNGLPTLRELPYKLRIAFVMALILSVFSSHSHHYLVNMLPKI